MLRCSARRKAGAVWRSTRPVLFPAIPTTASSASAAASSSSSSSSGQQEAHDMSVAAASTQHVTPTDATSEVEGARSRAQELPRRVLLREAPLRSFAPTAAEAPQLLQGYVEPTPFINPRRLQHFVVSMAVGAVSVGFVYYVLQDRISRDVSGEDTQLALLAERQRSWQEGEEDEELRERDRLSFIAPSTYEELRLKLAQSKREAAEREAAAAAQGQLERRSMFHAELIHRLKQWWNRSLDNVQAAVAQEESKESHVVGRIEATLRLRGYTLLRLSEAAAAAESSDAHAAAMATVSPAQPSETVAKQS